MNPTIKVRILASQPVSLQILKEMLEDADLFGYISAGAYADVYDNAAVLIFPKLSKDLSLSQIQHIIWDAFYLEFCTGVIGGTKEPWMLDSAQAMITIGSPGQFKGLALNIRHDIL